MTKSGKIDQLRGDTPDELREKGHAILGLYKEWRLEQSLSTNQFKERTGLSVVNLLKRKNRRIIPPFAEVLSVAQSLGIVKIPPPSPHSASIWWNSVDIQHVREEWIRDITRDSRRSTAIALLHTALASTGIRTTIAGVQTDIGISRNTAEHIAAFSVFPWENLPPSLKPLLLQTMGEKDFSHFKDQWISDLLREQSDMFFIRTFEECMTQQKITYAKIARVLGIEDPGVIRTLIHHPRTSIGYSHYLSRAILAGLVSRSHEQYEHLLRLSQTIRRDHRSPSYKSVVSPLRSAREVYGVAPEQVASSTGYNHEEILEIEQGIRPIDPDEEADLVATICHEGEQRVRAAVHILRKYEQPETIPALIGRLKEAAGERGGLKPLAETLAPGTPEEFGRLKLDNIESGKTIPTLALLRHIVQKGKERVLPTLTLHPDLEQNWSYRAAEHFAQKGMSLPLRALEVIRLKTFPSWNDYYRKHGYALRTDLHRLKDGHSLHDLTTIDTFLRDCAVTSECILFVHTLIDHPTDYRQAILQWVDAMQKSRYPIRLTFTHLPGLTQQESPKPSFDTVMQDTYVKYPHLPEQHRQCVEYFALSELLHDQSAPQVTVSIDASFGSTLHAASTEETKKAQTKITLQPLLKRAKEIDAATYSSAPDRIADALSAALEHGIADTEKLIRDILMGERLIQWAFTYNLTIASPYYVTLRRAIEESVQKGTSYEEIQQALQIKIDAIANRDQTIALDDAPGIHRAKSKTGRKTKGANNY